MAGAKEKTQPTSSGADALRAALHDADAVVAEARAVEREAMAESGRHADAGGRTRPSLVDLLSAVELVVELCRALLDARQPAPVVAEVYEATTGLPDKLRAALEQKTG